MGRCILNLYKETDMNNNVLKLAVRNKERQAASTNPHLWMILEDLSHSEFITHELSSAPIHDGKVTIQFSDKGKRVRKVVRRSNQRMTGKYPSLKNERMMHWESNYENEAIQILEANPSVEIYAEQAAIFHYSNGDGVINTHIPDLYVELKNGKKLFIEVKPSRATHDQELIDRTILLQMLLQEMGYRYFVIFPDQLDEMHYLKNVNHLIRSASKSVPYFIKEKLQRFLKIEGQANLANLINLIGDDNARGWIYKLLMSGILKCDLAEPISTETTITLN